MSRLSIINAKNSYFTTRKLPYKFFTFDDPLPGVT